MSTKEVKTKQIRGRDLFKDALAQKESVTVSHDVSILKERPWTFAEYGKNWALDTFAVTHNAIRAELGDLYGMVVSMVKRKDTVSLIDVENFFVWWPTFTKFALEALDFEEQMIFLPLDSRIALTGPVSQVQRDVILQEAKEKISKISNRITSFKKQDPRDLIGELVDFVDVTVPKLNSMFETAENETTAQMLRQKELEIPELQFFEDFCEYTQTLSNPHVFSILWMRGFTSVEQRSHFMDFFLKSKKKKLFDNKKKWSVDYQVAEEELNKTHFGAVREFWRAWRMADAYLNVHEQDIKYPMQKRIVIPAEEFTPEVILPDMEPFDGEDGEYEEYEEGDEDDDYEDGEDEDEDKQEGESDQ